MQRVPSILSLSFDHHNSIWWNDAPNYAVFSSLLLERAEEHTKFWSENQKGGDISEDIGVDGKIILEWVLEKQGGN
jgi:hypothetical protein